MVKIKKGSATYNIDIICILTTKSVTKNNVFIKKEGSQHAMELYHRWVTRILDLPFYANKYFSWVFTSSNY